MVLIAVLLVCRLEQLRDDVEVVIAWGDVHILERRVEELQQELEKIPAAEQGLRGNVEHWLGQREAAQERCRATVSKGLVLVLMF
jgi:cell division protein FtsB